MKLPFDFHQLDTLMDEQGIDALVVSSKHNVQYLLGGHRFFFFDYMDAIGTSRYLPLFLYFRGRPKDSVFIGNAMEGWQLENDPVWVEDIELRSWGTLDAMDAAIARLNAARDGRLVIGYEPSFLPADAYREISSRGWADLTSVEFLLERLRARKNDHEIDLVRTASELITESFRAVVEKEGHGTSKRHLVESLRREETERGLTFEYCLASMGASHNRAPSGQVWQDGDVLCLDSGGNYKGYIGDLARMAVLGQPDAELQDLLAEVDEVQLAARKPIRRGAVGEEIYSRAVAELEDSPNARSLSFVAHGMGLISHEAPRLTSSGPVPYDAYDRLRELESGMVLSIETTMLHSRRGFIKLEDTIVVTDDGFEALGDERRGWNVA